jgi:hypothetical protein
MGFLLVKGYIYIYSFTQKNPIEYKGYVPISLLEIHPHAILTNSSKGSLWQTLEM